MIRTGSANRSQSSFIPSPIELFINSPTREPASHVITTQSVLTPFKTLPLIKPRTSFHHSLSSIQPMKKLYRKGVVHPTPPVVSDHLLYLLPAAILTLTSALSLEDKEMLAYLISCSSANHRKTTQKTSSAGGADHPACFDCYCFRCYMSYWARWDSSPNRQLIHEIIDDFEDTLLKESEKQRNKKERNKLKGKISKGKVSLGLDTESKSSELSLTQQVTESNSHAVVGVEAVEVEVEDSLEEEELEKGSVGRLMSFLGERFWSVWG